MCMRSLKAVLLAAVTALAIAAPASANIVLPTTVSNSVRVPSLGNYGVGTALMTVSYTDADATATVTAPSVGLGNGKYFRIDTCIKVHALNNFYDSKCSESFVDTRSKTATIWVAAPTASMTRVRPAAASQAYFPYDVVVSSRQADGSYSAVATSWPLEGIAKAAAGIVPKGALTADTPAGEGSAL